MSTVYTGLITRPDITGLSTTDGPSTPPYHSLKVETNFDDNLIAVSDDKVGKVTIYNYDADANVWNTGPELTCGIDTLSNGFGVSLSMDWDAERIVVGANVLSNVYVFDSLNNWSNPPRVIEGNPGSEFGYSVSIAANDPELICIGAPLENKVYVYQDITANWNQVFVDDGASILSRIPLNPTSNIILKPDYNAYGYHVYMSADGDYVTAGAPGTYMSNIYTSNISKIETLGILSDPSPGLDYIFGVTYYTVPSDSMKHVGNARVLGRKGDTWGVQSGQIGSDIEGDPGKFILEDGFDGLGYFARGTGDPTTSGWCMPSFGWCTHITDDGSVITVSSPSYSPSGDRNFFSGKISRFRLSEISNEWEAYGLDLFSTNASGLLGHSFKLDFKGIRMSAGGLRPFLKSPQGYALLTGYLYTYEWSKESWSEVQEVTLLEDTGSGVSEGIDRLQVAMVSGKHAFVTSIRRGKLYTKAFSLTIYVDGNNLFTGFVAADVFHVGGNNGDSSNSTEKKIQFGGTLGDQSYTYTSIENRSLIAGSESELLLFKRSGGNKNTDILRLKSNEIHFDGYFNGDLITRVLDNLSSKFERTYDDKSVHRPSMVMNWRGSICIAPHILQDLSMVRTWYGSQYSTSPDFNYGAASCDSKAVLDVNGDVYIRNRLNVNDFDRNRVIGTWIYEPLIFYNTRNINVLYRDPTQTDRILVKSETRPFQFVIQDCPGVVEGTVNYLSEYRGFEFIGDGKITNIITNGTLSQERTRTSFWINLQGTQTTSNVFNITNPGANGDSVTFQLTPVGIKIEYENNSSSFDITGTYTFEQDKWYNIQVQLPGGINTPQVGDDSSFSFVGLWVNAIAQSLTLNGTAFQTDLTGMYLDLTLGGNTANIIVGMFMFWTSAAFNPDRTVIATETKLQTIQNVYNYGPPSEMLVVGGDATISGKLGVGVTNPTEALEVNGIIRNNNPRFYAYNNTGNTTTSTGVLNAFNLTMVNTGNHYDTTLSRFTAPVDGVYEFKFSALHRYVSGVGSSELTFAKNGTLATIRGVGYTFVTSTSDHDYNPAEVMIELVKGDYIEPYIHGVASGTDIYYGGGLAHFSGKFLG